MPDAGAVQLACGIGNPDAGYGSTRHNAGKWLLDQLAQRAAEQFKPMRDFAAVVAGNKQSMWLAKTTCYMNESGRPVAALLRYLQIAPANLLIAHDELDLAPGLVRFKFGGGLAGHNGLGDIARLLGTQDFWRLRIGIGRPAPGDEPAAAQLEKNAGAAWVLKAPAAAQRRLLDQALEEVVAGWQQVQEGNMDAAMRLAHRS